MAVTMKYRGSRVALLGLLFALALVLSLVESSLGGFDLVPGVKPGLSNIVVMYCVFFLGVREAYLMSLLKAGFVLMIRGPIGAAMSLCGGLCSVTVMLLLTMGKEGRDRVYFTSICGGLSHNAGQLLMAALVLKSGLVFYYLPVLALSGAAMGVLTGFLLRLLMPHFKRIFLK